MVCSIYINNFEFEKNGTKKKELRKEKKKTRLQREMILQEIKRCEWCFGSFSLKYLV